MTWPERLTRALAELGIEVPEAAAAVANYVGYVRSGNLGLRLRPSTAGWRRVQVPGQSRGRVLGRRGQEAARICAINIIAQLKAACGGDLDRVRRIVKLGGFVNSTPEFTTSPR